MKSDINVYEGYTEVVADGYQRSSQYVSMEDQDPGYAFGEWKESK